MTAASYVALALALVAVALLVAKQRSLRQALAECHRATSAASTRAEQAERLHQEGEASSQQAVAALEARVAGLEGDLTAQATAAEARLAELEASSRLRITELERVLHLAKVDHRRATTAAAASAAEAEAATARLTEADAEVAALRTAAHLQAPSPSAPEAGPDDGGDAGWRLLLARVERQWADLVNAGPGERGVVDGSRGEQLAQALQRELERLREEVGVETTMVVAGPVDAGHALTTLLAVGEAAAMLAARSEHVTVELRDQAVVTGQDWSGDDDARRRLDQLVATVSAGGRSGAVEPGDGDVRVVLG